ncbi:hypothetical protein JVU11DRAFT_5285 [Chiua virens]|nr:hypothetical protein JVU11DRAFT_5285 [Chiua virens]
MPPTRVSTITHDLSIGPRNRSGSPMITTRATDLKRTGRFLAEQKTTGTNRAASVPLSQPEHPRLDSLRLRKQKPSPVEDIPPSNVPTRGRKRDFKLTCASPQADGKASTLATVQDPIADSNEHRPRKKLKRSLSTPPASRPSQLSTHLQSRRRSRSRAGSPTTDVEYNSSSRVSRLARRLFFNNELNSDIYTHLADPGNAGSLLREPSIQSVISSTPSEMVGSQSMKKFRGRKRKVVDFTDENAKKNLMEEWARMRQSQGTLPLSGIDDNTCISRTVLRDAQKGDGSVSSMQRGAVTSPDPGITEATQTTMDASNGGSSSARTLGPAGTDTSGNTLLDHEDIVAPSTSIPDSPMDRGSPDNSQTAVPGPTSRLESRTPPPTLCTSTSQNDSVDTIHAKFTNLPVNGQAKGTKLDNPSKYSHSTTFPESHSFDDTGIPLDSDEDFHMLDIPELFTLPWVSVASHLYVPPGLGKLISGMREQLTMEARARGRAEELYQEELRRRIAAEKVIEELRAELEKREKDL